MGWTRVETANAKYRITLEFHGRRAKLPKESFDGLILEGVMPYDDLVGRVSAKPKN